MLVIDVNGAKNVRAEFPYAHLIFIKPPSMEELKARLIKRGTEPESQIEQRMKVVESEVNKSSLFDKVIINDTVNQATDEIVEYIQSFIGG